MIRRRSAASGAGCTPTADAQAAADARKTTAEMRADQRSDEENPPCFCTFTGDVADPRGCPAHDPAPRFTIHRTAPVIAPPNSRLQIACPQCHAAIGQRCKNYSGANCAPHGARKLPAQAAADARDQDQQAQTATAP